ncbi:hypothetical protein FJ366_01170 [Candidatus Dependentiae bacterium]|nr:hypothetical protein [Candidatus Dependentiae bacterium]
MKSLLQEANSIERAIYQAWEAAGSPQEFSIKIHDIGKKGFFGFSSKPAVVSITYKPQNGSGSSVASQHHAGSAVNQKQNTRGESARGDSGEFKRERDDRRPAQRNSVHSKDAREPRDRDSRDSREPREYKGLLAGVESEKTESASRGERRQPRREKSDFPRKNERKSDEPRGLLSYASENGSYDSAGPVAPKNFSTEEVVSDFVDSSSNISGDDAVVADVWEAAYVESVRAWLKEIIDTIGYDVTFQVTVASKTLHVDFSKDFVMDTDLSRSLYASLSFVLLQFLKREHKRRFRGLRITLSHPGQDPFRFDSAS